MHAVRVETAITWVQYECLAYIVHAPDPVQDGIEQELAAHVTLQNVCGVTEFTRLLGSPEVNVRWNVLQVHHAIRRPMRHKDVDVIRY